MGLLTRTFPLSVQLVQFNSGAERGVFAGVADAKDEFAGIDGPLVRGLIPVAEGARIKGKGDVLRFAGSEAGFFETLSVRARARSALAEGSET